MNDDDLLDLAYPYGLDSLDDAERREVDDRLAEASPAIQAEFGQIVASVHDTMAAVSAQTAVEPPAQLRQSILDEIAEPAKVIPMRRRWQVLAAGVAAVFALLVGSIVVVNQVRQPTEVTLAQSVQEAPDRTVTSLPVGGGRMTVTFSRQLEAAVLHMESVELAPDGKTYQLWLIDDTTPTSGGLMKDPNGDTTVANLSGTDSLALTIEPDGGSDGPTMTPLVVANL